MNLLYVQLNNSRIYPRRADLQADDPMNLTNNTLLITGGGSGIGRGLAESFHALGNRIIIAGRRQSVLEETAAANPGMQFLTFDQDDAESIRDFAQRLILEHPGLNVLVNNAGIQRVEDLTRGSLADTEATVTTNLLGPPPPHRRAPTHFAG